jgi:hypothetical protein
MMPAWRAILFAAAAVLCGCAALERPADFAPERYPGAGVEEKLLAKVNLETNLRYPCYLREGCQQGLPSRAQLDAAAFLDSKGYAMAKAYALQDAGIDESRMRIATIESQGRWHTVLVVDERYVLDSFYGDVRRISEYRRLHPTLAALPGTLMAQGRVPSAAVGR